MYYIYSTCLEKIYKVKIGKKQEQKPTYNNKELKKKANFNQIAKKNFYKSRILLFKKHTKLAKNAKQLFIFYSTITISIIFSATKNFLTAI